MRFISSASLGGQNISSSLLSASIAASAVEAITTRLFAAGVSGSANYLAFVTLQRLGTGSAYQVVPVTSASVELGTTSIALTTIPVPMDSTDILKVYFQGSASDTAAPSLWTYFYGENTGSAYTDARAAKLDNLDVLLSSRVSGSAYTDARAAKLDNADVAVSTRSSASDWTQAKSVFVDAAISGRAVAGDAMTLSDSAITAAKIASSAFSNAKFAAGAIGIDTVAASVIAACTLAGNAIGAPVIASCAITNAKIAAAAFGADSLGASAIAASNIASGAIGVGKLGASALSASNVSTNTLAVGTLGASALSASNIADGAITATATFGASSISASNFAASAISSGVFMQSAADEMWSSSARTLTMTAAQAAAAVAGSMPNIEIAVSYDQTISGLTIPATWAKMYLTIKNDLGDTDAQSLVQLLKSNPADATNDGLLYIGGASATKSQGYLTVSQAGGTIQVVIASSATDDLSPNEQLDYGFKTILSSGSATNISAGKVNIREYPTRTV